MNEAIPVIINTGSEPNPESTPKVYVLSERELRNISYGHVATTAQWVDSFGSALSCHHESPPNCIQPGGLPNKAIEFILKKERDDSLGDDELELILPEITDEPD